MTKTVEILIKNQDRFLLVIHSLAEKAKIFIQKYGPDDLTKYRIKTLFSVQ